MKTNRNIILLTISSCLFMSSVNSDAQTKEKLRMDISVEELMAGAMKESSTAMQIKLDIINGQVRQLQARAGLDTNFFTNLEYSSSETEPLSPVGPESQDNQKFTFGTATKFSSGTQLTASLSASSLSIDYPQAFANQNVDTGGSTVSIAVKQSLWADSFGTATRDRLDSADSFYRANSHDVRDKLEKYAIQVGDTFFRARRSQLTTEAFKQIEDDQKELLDISKVLLGRGNLERPDYLQIEATYLNSVEDYKNATANLQNTWNSTITNLSLPLEYKEVDARNIELKYKSRSAAAARICLSKNKIDLKQTNRYKNLANQLNSSELLARAAKNDLKPNLDFELSLGATNFEDKAFDAMKESLTFKSPTTSVALKFAVPLNNYIDKAQLFQRAKQLESIKISHFDYEYIRITELENACVTYDRAQDQVKTHAEIFKIQKKRAVLDLERFQLGTVDATQAIRSSIAKTNSWRVLENSKLEAQRAAWQLIYLAGELEQLAKAKK